MFELFGISDHLIMELAVYFILFMNVMSIGVFVNYVYLRNVRFLMVGNLAFLLMHLAVLVNIHTSLQMAFFVALFNFIGIAAYVKAVSEIFGIEVRYKTILVIQGVHLLIVITLLLLQVDISFVRMTTMLAIVSILILFLFVKTGKKYKEIKLDTNTVSFLVTTISIHFAFACYLFYRAISQQNMDQIRASINVFTIFLLMYIVWVNFSVFFASYYVLTNQYKHLSYHDYLTKLPNRRNFMEQFERHIHLVKRNQIKFGLISMDIDGFKEINDTYGHLQGDAYLKDFSKEISKHVRKTDLFFRIGGDEFMVLTHSKSEEELKQTLNRMIEATKSLTITDLQAPIRFSAGCLFVHPDLDLDHPNKILDTLDSYLYQAKNLV
jgi:diguanylate cyclase (GGDEF)-like protein